MLIKEFKQKDIRRIPKRLIGSSLVNKRYSYARLIVTQDTSNSSHFFLDSTKELSLERVINVFLRDYHIVVSRIDLAQTSLQLSKNVNLKLIDGSSVKFIESLEGPY